MRSAPGRARSASSTARSRRMPSSKRASRGSSTGRPRGRSTPPTRRSSAWRSRSPGPTPSGSATRSITTASSARCGLRTSRSAQRAIYKHNDLADLAQHLARVPDGMRRVVVIFDGIFSMRGDNAPVDAIAIARRHARASISRRRRHGDGRFARDRARTGEPAAAPRNTAARASTSSSARSARRSA